MPGDLPHDPGGFDAFAGFTGGVDQPAGEDFLPAGGLFDSSGLALQFGPSPTGLPAAELGDLGQHDVSWYDAPHHW